MCVCGVCVCARACGRLVHRVFLTGIEGGDYWLDQKVLRSVFTMHGTVLDVFLPPGKKVCLPILLNLFENVDELQQNLGVYHVGASGW